MLSTDGQAHYPQKKVKVYTGGQRTYDGSRSIERLVVLELHFDALPHSFCLRFSVNHKWSLPMTLTDATLPANVQTALIGGNLILRGDNDRY